ncbi:MAG: hypothetical protein ACRDJH_15740 [Thermomicrobiales bacterium]
MPVGNYEDVVQRVLQYWDRLGRPNLGTFIQGSVARLGYVAPGADLDLCVITPIAAPADWFEEGEYDELVIEIYPLALQECHDVQAVLSSPALPFAICDGIVVHDPRSLLAGLKARLSPRLCDPHYRRARAQECYERGQEAYKRARIALARNDLAMARVALVQGLWHITGIPSAAECESPTMRRAFVRLEAFARRRARPDLVERAKTALAADAPTAAQARTLVEYAAAIKPRYRHTISPMVEAGEAWQSAWPLLCAAVLSPSGARPDPVARDRILRALGAHSPSHMAERLLAAEMLAVELWGVARHL